MNFRNFLSRLDEILIARILGHNSIKILESLDTDLTRIRNLQAVIKDLFSPKDLLTNKSIRNELFDLLKPEEIEELLLKLGKTTDRSSAYKTIKQINFNSLYELNVLFDFFEIIIDKETEIKHNVNSESIKPNYPLFKHQRKANQEINYILSKHDRVLLHMPTGSGKTRTAMDFICKHLRNNEPTTVIWLAHTEELCEQAYQEFRKAWSTLGNRDLNSTRFWGAYNSDISIIKDGFIVCGLSKLYSLTKQSGTAISSLANNSSLVIMDEAHMAIAPTFKLNLSILISFKAKLIGLSATPGRTYNDVNQDLELSNFFKKQKVTLKIDNYNNPVDYLINEGYLAKIKNTKLLYDSGIKVSENDLDYLRNNLFLSDSFLKQLSQDHLRNIFIIQKIEDLISKHKRIIVFALSVEHSNTIAICLKARGHNAYSLTGQTDTKFRKNAINAFKENNSSSMVICNYGILTTGFDAPNTSCAVITRPTDSLVLYSQMVGRAIRGPKANGNAEAEIVTVVDTQLPGFDNVSNAFFNWEDIWQ